MRFLICQQEQDEIAAGRELLRQLMEHASRFVREEIPVSELIVGMKAADRTDFPRKSKSAPTHASPCHA